MALTPGCAGTSAEGSFREMAGEVERRTGHSVTWNQGGEADAEVDKKVRALLQGNLSEAAAVQIALLNNRHLQAQYEDLSVAQADLVQAGLLKNPVFDASLRFPVASGGHGMQLDFGLEEDFLGLLFMPAKKKLAGAELERAKLRVGTAVMELAAEVRVAYFSLQSALQVLAMRRTILEAALLASDLAARQGEAGTMSDLDIASEQASTEQVRLDVARSEGEALLARENLTRLMGLWGASTGWTISEMLPELPAADPPLDHVESEAMRQRLDIAAARANMQVAAHAASIASGGRWIGGLDVGATAEREGSDPWTVGPAARLEIPIFDQGQAKMALVDAELRRARHELAALAVDARSEVRSARARLVLARAIAEHYRKVLVPLRERVVALSQQQYDAMLLGVYQLLRAKRDEVETYREYIESARDYWIAWAELERDVGGRLERAPAPASASSATNSTNAANSSNSSNSSSATSPAQKEPAHHEHKQ